MRRRRRLRTRLRRELGLRSPQVFRRPRFTLIPTYYIRPIKSLTRGTKRLGRVVRSLDTRLDNRQRNAALRLAAKSPDYSNYHWRVRRYGLASMRGRINREAARQCRLKVAMADKARRVQFFRSKGRGNSSARPIHREKHNRSC